MLALRGWVIGTEEANAWLCEQVTRHAEGLSILENIRVGKYLFCFRRVGFFLWLDSELVILFLELGGKVESLEQDLVTAEAMISQNAEALAKSLEERRALEGELDQMHNVA